MKRIPITKSRGAVSNLVFARVFELVFPFVFSLVFCVYPAMAQNDVDTDSASAEIARERDAREHEAAEAKANELLAAPDLPDGTKKVSLADALRFARNRNLTLKQMDLEFEKADARLRQARALLMPVAQAEGRELPSM